MKKLIYTILFFANLSIVSQNNNDGITIGAYVPEQAEAIPAAAKRMLIDKLGKIITANGISDDVNNSRFILVPNATVVGKDIIASAPIRIALSLDLTLYLGDGVAGNLFATESITLKGVGTNETKAYIAAIKNLKAKNPNIQSFISKGKEKIINYYNSNCSNINKKVISLESQGDAVSALVLLSNIPESSSCFDSRLESKMKRLYKRAIDQDCKEKINIANGIWVANQNITAANKVGEILSSIDPNSSCFNDVKRLYDTVGKRVKELSDRGWNYQLKELDLEVSTIKAARDVGMAYGNNQPTHTHNIKGWF
jgi:hypothetical protein